MTFHFTNRMILLHTRCIIIIIIVIIIIIIIIIIEIPVVFTVFTIFFVTFRLFFQFQNLKPITKLHSKVQIEIKNKMNEKKVGRTK